MQVMYDIVTVVSAEITRPGQMTTTKPVTSSEGESAPATVPGQETTTAPKTSPEYANTTVAGQEVTTKGEEAQTTAATDSSTEPSSSEEPVSFFLSHCQLDVGPPPRCPQAV